MPNHSDKLKDVEGGRCVCGGCVAIYGTHFQIQILDGEPTSLRVIEILPVYGRETHFFSWPDEINSETLESIAWDLLDTPEKCEQITLSLELQSMLVRKGDIGEAV